MNADPKVGKLVRMALLVAIIFLLAFTPLGYLVLGPISATTIQMPVIIGAILLGPGAGAVLGGFFGLSAIIKVLTMPGADAVASAILAVQPFLYVVIAVVPRVLMGWLSGLLSLALRKCLRFDKTGMVTFGVTGFVGSMLNTVFYLGGLWLLASSFVAEAYQVDVSGVGALVLTTAYTFGIPEAAVSCIVVAAVCKALVAFVPGFKKPASPEA